jgi:phosphoglycerate dehydrogenase-like enzyme
MNSVTDPEPLEDGHPFYTLPNVVLTPHMSGLSVDYFTRTIDLLVKNVELLRSGRGALNAVRGKGEDLM